MMGYKSVVFGEGETEVASCDLCGALVNDEELHDIFHRMVNKALNDASYAASMHRPIRILGGE